MHLKDNLTNFLYDKNYFLAFYENYLYIFNYLTLDLLTDTKIILTLEQFKLIIQGKDLFIKKMLPHELLLQGQITNLEFENA